MVTQASVFGIGLGSAGVANCSVNNAGQAAEDGFGSPEAPEGEDSHLQALLVGLVEGGWGDPIGKSDAESIVHEDEE